MTKDVPTEKTRITSASPHIAKARSASVLAVSVASSDRDVCFAATCQRGNPAEHSTASSTGLESTAAGAAERDDTSPQKPTTGAGCGGSSDDAISDDDSSSFVPDGSPSNSDLELFDPDEEELDESPPPRQQHALPRFLDQIATPAEGGEDGAIWKVYSKLKKRDMFQKASEGVVESWLTPDELAGRAAQIFQANSRKSRSPRSHEAVNSAVALFTSFMLCSDRRLAEPMDDEEKQIFYPSPAKLIQFATWNRGRAALRAGGNINKRLQCTSLSTAVANLSAWAVYLKAINPRRFVAAIANPCTSPPVVVVMRAMSQAFAERLISGEGDFLAGSSVFETFGHATHVKMMEWLIMKANMQPRSALRLTLDTNLRKSILARGELTRALGLKNIGLLDEDLSPRLGPHESRVLITTWRSGKTIKQGRHRNAMSLEHINPLLCPIFSLGLYLWWRFDVDRDPLPDFSDRRSWYGARIFTGTDPGTAYTSNAQYHAIRTMHQAHGVAGHVAHACRIAGSMLDARNRVSPEETASVTHVKDGSHGPFSTCSLVYRPLSIASALSQSGSVLPGESVTTAIYFNARQQLDPPPHLVNMIFRGFEEQREILQKTIPGWATEKKTEKATLDLISHLRLVLLRSAAVVALDHPDWVIFTQPPFSTSDFREWATLARTKVEELTTSHLRARNEHVSARALATSITALQTENARLNDRIERVLHDSATQQEVTRQLVRALVDLSASPGGGAERLLGLLRTVASGDCPTMSENANRESGWFTGKLKGFSECGSIGALYDLWLGRGPAFVFERQEGGLSLKAHGQVSSAQIKQWASPSTYQRYKQAGTHLEKILTSLKEGEPNLTHDEAVAKMISSVNSHKGERSLTQWFYEAVVRAKGHGDADP